MQSGILGLGSNKWALLILPSKGVGSYGLALEGMDLMKLGEKKVFADFHATIYEVLHFKG